MEEEIAGGAGMKKLSSCDLKRKMKVGVGGSNCHARAAGVGVGDGTLQEVDQIIFFFIEIFNYRPKLIEKWPIVTIQTIRNGFLNENLRF
jgi:hypothetical protein